MQTPLKLGLLADYLEEGWPSMDLFAEMLHAQLQHGGCPSVTSTLIRPPFRRRLSLLPRWGTSRTAFNADRLWNRFLDYPAHLRRIRRQCDWFHLCDHSYAQLLLHLPTHRTGVYCHDLCAFESLLGTSTTRFPLWYKAIMRRIWRGFTRASLVFYVSPSTGRQLRSLHVFPEDRLIHCPPGIAEEFVLEPPHVPLSFSLPFAPGTPYLLHVGSCVTRKRIDVLLDVFAQVRQHRPDVKLLQIGGPFTAAQREQMQRLRLTSAVVQLQNLSRLELAHCYRQASLVLQTSEMEGMGMPVIEALACGALVLATDLPVFHEAAGPALAFSPLADIDHWTETALRLLDSPSSAPPLSVRLSHIHRYRWSTHAATIAQTYQRLAHAT